MTARHASSVGPWTLLAAAAILIAAALPSEAQRGAPAAVVPPTCGVDSAAPWYRKQLTWLDAKVPPANDTLRTMMLGAVRPDQAKLSAVQLGVSVAGRASVARTADIDSAIARLRRGGRGGPWPTRTAVGPVAARTVTLLALADTGFMLTAVRRMQEAGPDESFAADVALLEDRLRLQRGRKQLYGTQFRIDANGTIVLEPMEDSAHADLRREGAGLPPFAVGLCLVKSSR